MALGTLVSYIIIYLPISSYTLLTVYFVTSQAMTTPLHNLRDIVHPLSNVMDPAKVVTIGPLKIMWTPQNARTSIFRALAIGPMCKLDICLMRLLVTKVSGVPTAVSQFPTIRVML